MPACSAWRSRIVPARRTSALLESRITGPLRMKSTAVTAPRRRSTSRIAVGHDAAIQAGAPLERARACRRRIAALQRERHACRSSRRSAIRQVSSSALPTMVATRRPGSRNSTGSWVVDRVDLASRQGHPRSMTVGPWVSRAPSRTTRRRRPASSSSRTASRAVGDIARHILRPVVPLTAPAGAAPQKKEIQVDPAFFDRYAGRYEPAPGVAFTLTREARCADDSAAGHPEAAAARRK